MELIIVEKNGWSKPIKADRAVLRVGSAAANDIQLQSPKIAPVHIQLLYSPETASKCKVVNLAYAITARIAREVRPLPPYAAVDVHDGDEILFGDYSITFRLPLTANVIQPATMLQASLSFADAVLRDGFATTGVLTIKNTGAHSACQFQVEVQGLPPDCFQVDPIPLMYAGAQEDVRIRVFHRTLYPPAGLHTIVVKVSAPHSYPGEELVIQQGLYVDPVFKHTLELIDDLSVAAKPKEQAGAVAQPAAVVDAETQPELESSVSNSPTQQEISDHPGQKQTAYPSKPDLSKLKIVRAPADEDEDAIPTPAAVPAEEYPAPSPAIQTAPKEVMPVPSRPTPDISNLKVVRAADEDENSIAAPAAVQVDAAPSPAIQTELPAPPAPKEVMPVPTRPAPDMSNLKVVRAPVVDEDQDAAPTPDFDPSSSVQPVPKPIMPTASRPAPDITTLKVVRAPVVDDDQDATPISATVPLEDAALNSSAQITPTPRPAPDMSNLKVVRNAADVDKFWDERE